MSMTPKEMLAELKAFEPTKPSEWTWRDRFIYRLTGHVSQRVYDDRMACLARDDARCKAFEARLRS